MIEEINQEQQELIDKEQQEPIDNEEFPTTESLQKIISNMVSKQIEGITNQLKVTQEENRDLKQKHYKIEMQKKLKDNGLENSNWLDVLYDEDEKIADFKIETVKKIIAEEVQRGVDKRIKDGSYTPPGNNNWLSSSRTSSFDSLVKGGK
ncbi:hypothetical protein ITJ11_019305 [Clostridioides difficile]|uniref:hypothetical protein n=1 Tax=Clostridioides difficile TaxID=1496 RepID=UPI00188A8F31|nr:hypothetical protein [Clostridioides difficile]MBY2486245.1 hypothetical protein [Clostridioides difficile]MDF3327430.1 hypothetical protein [Clostridioides difficile]HBF8537287.1 hypothetical protein [Clostridioides difficile]